MAKTCVFSKKGPAPKGPYSPAVICGDLVFVSGQGPIDPATGQMTLGSIEQEAALTLDNVKAVLEEAGSSMDKVLKTSVFLADLDDFAAFNAVYGRYFPADRPARTTVGGSLLAGMKVEIDCIASLK